MSRLSVISFKKGAMMQQRFILTALSSLCSLASAQGVMPPGSELRAIMPVYSQLLAFSYPKGFVPVFEQAKNGSYIQESVLKGESVQRWSQMITVTGARGLASNPEQSPLRFASELAAGFRDACPDSFAVKDLGEFKLGRHDAFSAVISCGYVNGPAGARSESALVIVIKGRQDYYTLQWAERGRPSQQPLSLNDAKWSMRLKQLAPLALCPIVPGEAAPYPSCSAGPA